jgi:hypothetical protein
MKTRKKHIVDFSDIESDPEGFKEIQRLISEAGRAAASEAKAVGIPRVYAKDNQVIQEEPDGTIKVIAETSLDNPFFIEMKESVLHARKK